MGWSQQGVAGSAHPTQTACVCTVSPCQILNTLCELASTYVHSADLSSTTGLYLESAYFASLLQSYKKRNHSSSQLTRSRSAASICQFTLLLVSSSRMLSLSSSLQGGGDPTGVSSTWTLSFRCCLRRGTHLPTPRTVAANTQHPCFWSTKV